MDPLGPTYPPLAGESVETPTDGGATEMEHDSNEAGPSSPLPSLPDLELDSDPDLADLEDGAGESLSLAASPNYTCKFDDAMDNGIESRAIDLTDRDDTLEPNHDSIGDLCAAYYAGRQRNDEFRHELVAWHRSAGRPVPTGRDLDAMVEHLAEARKRKRDENRAKLQAAIARKREIKSAFLKALPRSAPSGKQDPVGLLSRAETLTAHYVGQAPGLFCASEQEQMVADALTAYLQDDKLQLLLTRLQLPLNATAITLSLLPNGMQGLRYALRHAYGANETPYTALNRLFSLTIGDKETETRFLARARELLQDYILTLRASLLAPHPSGLPVAPPAASPLPTPGEVPEFIFRSLILRGLHADQRKVLVEAGYNNPAHTGEHAERLFHEVLALHKAANREQPAAKRPKIDGDTAQPGGGRRLKKTATRTEFFISDPKLKRAYLEAKRCLGCARPLESPVHGTGDHKKVHGACPRKIPVPQRHWTPKSN